MRQYIHFINDETIGRGTMCIELPESKVLIKAEKALAKGTPVHLEVKAGFAVCSEKDQFDKSKGRLLSAENLHSRLIQVHDVRAQEITTKKGPLKKTVIRCSMLFAFRQNCERLKFEAQGDIITMTIDFDITHVGLGSEPRMHYTPIAEWLNTPIKYAMYEKQTKWILNNRKQLPDRREVAETV